MSFLLPRRVKDLPQLEPDSEDEYKTPQKSDSNKKTEGKTHLTYSSNDVTTKRMPQRVSELPPLEPDSDDEDFKNDRHNCAILNDSFLISPAKSDQEDELDASPLVTKLQKMQKSATNATQDLGSESFLRRFGSMQLSESASRSSVLSTKGSISDLLETDENINPQNIRRKTDSRSKENFVNSILSVTSKNPLVPTQSALKPINENEISECAVIATKPIADNTRIINHAAVETAPLHATTAIASFPSSTTLDEIETPFKSVDGHFVTPQIRSWSFARKPRDLCSTQSQKTRTAIANEFRSQKVLFQTPMAMTRAPIACMPNDSITLSLWDSVNENGTPNTAEKEPRTPSQPETSCSKSKISLESKFNGCGESNGVVDSVMEPETKHAEAKQSYSTSVSSSSTSTTVNSKETIVKINGSFYVITKKLGSGGSSSVYLAYRKDIGKECALKIVDLRGDKNVVEGYLNETKLLEKLQGNICVVNLYEYELVSKESKLYMVMEKGDSDLDKILQTYKTYIPLYVLIGFWYQMLHSVNYIHQNGVIHSDLKPANFLMANGRLKLIDFGIASNIAIDSTSIIKFSQAGTFNYISPEALTDTSTGNSPMGKNQPKIKISTKSDVWSLGCILYLLLYRKTPFGHIKNIYAKVNAITSPTTEIEYPAIAPFYPVMLTHMAKSCLQHNPKNRPSVAELLRYPFHMVIPIQNLNIPQK